MTKHKILVADDDKEILRIILKYFDESSKKKYELICVPTGKMVPKILTEKEIHLILLDWNMPDMDGITVLENIIANPKTKDIPVLMITGRTANKDLEFALEKGAHDYIKKPIDKVELLARSTAALRLYEHIKQIKKQKLALESTHNNLVTTYQKVQLSEQKLSKMNHIKDNFFSVISHDLKSPLDTLQMLIKMLLDEIDSLDKKETEKLIGSIDNRLDETQLLLTNLLKWAQSQMDGLEVVNEAIDLKKIIAQNLTFVKENIKRKEIRLELQENNRFAKVLNSDPNMLDFLARNLIYIILKNSKNVAKVVIASTFTKTHFEFQVKSSATNWEIRKQQDVFNLETYTSQSKEISERSVGLGLLLCKEFIEANQGKIAFETQGEYLGFTFSLPLNA